MELKELIVERKTKKIFRDGDKLIKLFDENYSKSNILNEALNQSRVEETGLNIPKIREVSLIDGKWAIVMDYIEGETLESLMKKNPEKIDEYIEYFCKIQSDIHSRKSPLLTKYKDKMVSKIMQSDLDASSRYDLCLRLNEMPMHNHLCHGDFIPSNVVITKDGTPYILDWSHASQGNATADATKTYLLFKLQGEEETAEKYIDVFCKKTNVKREYVDAWIPLIAAAQLLKSSPENKKFFRSVIYKYYES